MRRPPPLEYEVHVAIADVLQYATAPGWIWFHVPNGGERPTKVNKRGQQYSPEASRLKRMGVKPGVSDFLFVAPGRGQLHVLELKRQNEKPNADQVAFMNDVVQAGGQAAWTDNFNGAMTILQRWGAIRTVS